MCDALDLGYITFEWEAVDKYGRTMVYLGLGRVLPRELLERLIVHHVLKVQRLREDVSQDPGWIC